MSENEVFSKLASIITCPICGGELEKGFFNAPRGVYWSNRKHVLGMILADYVMPSALWSQDNVPALKCENCGIAVIDYRAPGYTPKSFLKTCVKCGNEIPIASEECPYCEARQKEEISHG
ncbi:MAG: PF20097 family protein [Candidatus Bathyarchaeota archaeon]|nr:PF20097 family protein [Candidatus Bathyarchaeota archaeon]MDH5788539.1 PF20097 family protein [Candidatus Bathyarchaeota archaeon]